MELSFEEKISLTLGSLIPSVILEAKDISGDIVDVLNKFNIDRRLGVTKEYAEYYRILEKLGELRSLGRAAGLDVEFASIFRRTIGPEGIDKLLNGGVLSYDQAVDLANAFEADDFDAKLEEAERSSKSALPTPPRTIPKKVMDAIAFLQSESSGRYPGKGMTLQSLINPKKLNVAEEQIIRYGKGKTYRFDDTTKVTEQFGQVALIIFELEAAFPGHFRDLADKLKSLIAAKMVVMDHYLADNPRWSDDQKRVTATTYSLREIGDEITERVAAQGKK